MLRIFLTRLANSVIRAGLLIPCLLIGLACATPTQFPIENLEKGMTPEAVREKFGAPIETDLEGVESTWTYLHEERDRLSTVMSYSVFLPHCILLTAATMPFIGAESWCDVLIDTIEEKPVVLHFEEEKLVRWEVIEPVPVVSSGYAPNSALHEMMRKQDQWFRDQQRMADYLHHKKGHTHHHVDHDDC